jgi:DHA2 family multidrug resistance protein
MSQAAALPAAPSAPVVSSSKWLVAVAVSLGALLEIIDTSIVNVALPQMQASLGSTLSQASWVVSSYGIANVIILPLSAWLGIRFGKKNYFVFSLVGFTVASIMCGLSTSLWMLVVARVLQGLTGGGLLAKAQAILFETFPKEEQPTAQAFFGAIVIAGPAIGPTLGGYIVTNIGWRWIFFINLPVGIIAFFMATTFLAPDDKKKLGAPRKAVDWTAIGLLAVGLGCLQTFLEEGNDEDWFDSRFIITLAVVAVIALIAFVKRELASKDPVVDLRVLKHRSLWAGSIISTVIGITLYGAMFAVPVFAQNMLHYSSQQTGMLLLPGAIAAAITMQIAGRVVRKVDPRIALAFGACVLLTSLGSLASAMNPGMGGHDFFWPLVIRSVGTVFMFLPLQLAAIGPIPRQDIAAATGFFNLTRQLGGSMGVAVLTLVLDRRTAFHHAVLAEKLVNGAPEVTARVQTITSGLAARGLDPATAHQRALALLDGAVHAQASVLSFIDTFWGTALVLVLALPLIFLLGKPPSGVPAAGGGGAH